MSKTHYQAPWVEKSEESCALCNDTMDTPTTSIYADDVDCKRCLKLIDVYEKRGKRIRRRGILSTIAGLFE